MATTMLAFHGKNCFTHVVEKREVLARTACLILQFQNLEGNYSTLMIEGEKNKDELEFPGGKVEGVDEDIYDTCFRETWEEVILGDIFPLEGNWHLEDWPAIRQKILSSDEQNQKLVSDIYKKLQNAPNVIYGSCPLKTIYFIVTISLAEATTLINNHNLIPVSSGLLKTVISNPGFTKKNTYIHTMEGDYRIRGRDFDGIYQYGSELL